MTYIIKTNYITTNMSQQITKRKCPWGGKYADHNGYCNPLPGEEHTHCFTYSNYDSDSDSESKPESEIKQPEIKLKTADVLPALIAPKPKSQSKLEPADILPALIAPKPKSKSIWSRFK
jgi:hypothetical protein